MIDFRYHLVSTIAIFMALALGIVVGTTQLNDQVLDNLKGSISSLTGEKRELESRTRELQGQVAQDDEFLTSVSADLVRGDLAGETVLLVTVPGTPSDLASDLIPLLETAGATVVGRLQLKDALLDPAKGQTVDDVVLGVRPPALQLPTDDPAARAGTVLAAALVRDPADTGISEDAAEEVVGGLSGAGLVDLDREQGAPRRATLALVLAPGVGETAPDAVALARSRAVLAVTSALDARSKGVVVAGPVTATRDGGLVEAVRDDTPLAEEVSTVDSADRPFGQVLVVKALAEQVRGTALQLGAGQGADAAVPSAPPS